MKKLFIITSIFTILFSLEMKAQQPPFFWQEGHNIGINAGYKKLSLNSGTFDVGFVELSCFINPSLGWEFTSKIEYGNDYFSFSPSGLIGLPFWAYSTSHGNDRDMNTIGALLSVASAKLPLYILDWLEITPYWDLLKFTKIYDNDKFIINGDLGLQVKIYPLCESNVMNTLYITGFCLYNYAYKKDASKYYYEHWSKNIKRTDKSLFYGYSYGATIGYYF